MSEAKTYDMNYNDQSMRKASSRCPMCDVVVFCEIDIFFINLIVLDFSWDW